MLTHQHQDLRLALADSTFNVSNRGEFQINGQLFRDQRRGMGSRDPGESVTQWFGNPDSLALAEDVAALDSTAIAPASEPIQYLIGAVAQEMDSTLAPGERLALYLARQVRDESPIRATNIAIAIVTSSDEALEQADRYLASVMGMSKTAPANVIRLVYENLSGTPLDVVMNRICGIDTWLDLRRIRQDLAGEISVDRATELASTITGQRFNYKKAQAVYEGAPFRLGNGHMSTSLMHDLMIEAPNADAKRIFKDLEKDLK